MTNVQIANQKYNPEIISKLVLQGDISKMTDVEKTAYYGNLCEAIGLNPFTQPFQILKLQGKDKLYATKDCTEQLRKLHGVSIIDITSQNISDVFVVTVKASDKEGRTDAATGAVTIGNLKGDALANALMKAETKAKRRVTLSICGLGMLDETEIETIPGATVGYIEAPVSDKQLEQIDHLLHNSTLSIEIKEKIELEMSVFSQAKGEKCINYLKQNQKESLNEQWDRAIRNDE